VNILSSREGKEVGRSIRRDKKKEFFIKKRAMVKHLIFLANRQLTVQIGNRNLNFRQARVSNAGSKEYKHNDQ